MTPPRQLARRFLWVPCLALLIVATIAALVSPPDSAPAKPGNTSVRAPSGLPAPTGDLPGWRQSFVEDFSAPQLPEAFSAYSGAPGGDPYTTWDPNNVWTENGKLFLHSAFDGASWVTGGVSNWPIAQTYGRWEVRLRADASDETSLHMLLWPQAENWPPEIDFAENFGGDRSQLTAFVHWLDDVGNRQKSQRDTPIDLTQWHTVGVEWLPGEIRYLLNGQVWATEAGDRVPKEPMWLGMQAQGGACAKATDGGQSPCPRVGTPAVANVEIDWVAIYSADPEAKPAG